MGPSGPGPESLATSSELPSPVQDPASPAAAEPSFFMLATETESPASATPDAPSLAPTSSSASSARRGKSFVKEDQLLLCKCFLGISEDPIVGRYQKGSAFFGKVADAFNAAVIRLGEPEKQRAKDSITAHWRDTIQKKVTKFCGCYAKAKAVTRSGWTEQNYIDEALTIYLDSCGGAFIQLRCWEFLRKKPKWVGCVAALSTTKRLLADSLTAPTQASVPTNRPVGNKKAKRVAHEYISKSKAGFCS
ncbi:hypothetical protein PR003_g23719 [Phytophthora rubi]|uniref:No apical meristem-associated C-terminal domain-containing protein n=1 Tax=Phytophthora rubi TaxID=129364 RepID=A0A6A4CUD4_9STRA|nr:hypothetical protein PR003_g23719 [Phytophthora rubi]